MVAPSFHITLRWTSQQRRQNFYMNVFALLVRPSWLWFFHSLIQPPGQSVYWQSMFQNSQDPTFVLLTFIWHARYAWDEALENLYEHICSLVSRVSFSRLMHPNLQTGRPCNLNYRHATYSRTPSHQSPSSSLPLSPRSLYKTYYLHQKYT